ncbi:MAG: 2-keto-4-pentenoate hydratase/2-oxohepta-3-ene-1,7-dioic acid hydratase [Candidatus Aminicenantes bacterium]|nr:2-keto-4-pentenoate hydratase/2-oxohepta-3-ene-1,7-dioic acid hydratase [Candidatus Aminicenantes bacterium]
MKIYRFRYRKRILQGVLKEEYLFPVVGSVFGDFRLGTSPVPIADVRILPPVLPTKIIGIGRNYRDHAQELNNPLPEEPLVFLKPPTALIGTLDAVVMPPASARVDYEGEVGVVIRKRTRQLRDDDPVDDAILGYTCFNDVTARDLQAKDVQFTRAKGFDTFAAVGPCVSTGLDPASLRLKTFLNGKLVQSGTTANLIFPIPHLVRFLSRIMTLNPGDIIATGTPAGVGPVSPGDRVDVQIEGIGVLSNPFRRPAGKEDP